MKTSNNYSFISRLFHLQTYKLHKGKVIYENLRLSNSESIVDRFFLSQTFVTSIGTIEYDTLREGCFMYATGNTDQFRQIFEARSLEINGINITNYFLRLIQMFLNCLWFVKDNSINTELGFSTIDTKKGPIISSNSRAVYFTKADGQVSDTFFNQEELTLALDIYSKMKKDNMPISNNEMPANHMQLQTANRIERALYFIQAARAQSNLLSKITLYCSILETLLTIDSSEVTHKIAERAAKILAEDVDSRESYFNIIKNAYNVRSKFIHGQTLSGDLKKTEKLIQVSIDVDTIIRILFKKIFDDDNLREVFLYDNTKLNNWFTRLILK